MPLPTRTGDPVGLAALAGARALGRRALVDRCSISRPGTPVHDDAGGETTPYTDVPGAVNLPCRVRPTGGDERPVGAAQGQVATWLAWLPAGTDVRATDRVVATVVERNETRTLEVLPPVGARTHEALRRVNCVEAT